MFFDYWFLICFKIKLFFFHFYLPVDLIINEMWWIIILKLAAINETVINKINDSRERYLAKATVKPLSFKRFILYQHKPIPPYFARQLFFLYFKFSGLWGWIVLFPRQLMLILNARQHYFGHSRKKMSASFDKFPSVCIEDMIFERVN